MLLIRCEFGDLALVGARLREMDATIEQETFVANGAELTVRAPRDNLDAITSRIVDLTRGRIQPRRID